MSKASVQFSVISHRATRLKNSTAVTRPSRVTSAWTKGTTASATVSHRAHERTIRASRARQRIPLTRTNIESRGPEGSTTHGVSLVQYAEGSEDSDGSDEGDGSEGGGSVGELVGEVVAVGSVGEGDAVGGSVGGSVGSGEGDSVSEAENEEADSDDDADSCGEATVAAHEAEDGTTNTQSAQKVTHRTPRTTPSADMRRTRCEPAPASGRDCGRGASRQP